MRSLLSLLEIICSIFIRNFINPDITVIGSYEPSPTSERSTRLFICSQECIARTQHRARNVVDPPSPSPGHPAADERQRLRHVRVHVRGVLGARRRLQLLAGAHALPAPQDDARDRHRQAAAVAPSTTPLTALGQWCVFDPAAISTACSFVSVHADSRKLTLF